MRRRELITLIGGATAWPVTVRAQQASNLPTIGVLGAGSASVGSLVAAFVKRLRELGWIEGRTVAIEYHCDRRNDPAYVSFHRQRTSRHNRLQPGCGKTGNRGSF